MKGEGKKSLPLLSLSFFNGFFVRMIVDLAIDRLFFMCTKGGGSNSIVDRAAFFHERRIF